MSNKVVILGVVAIALLATVQAWEEDRGPGGGRALKLFFFHDPPSLGEWEQCVPSSKTSSLVYCRTDTDDVATRQTCCPGVKVSKCCKPGTQCCSGRKTVTYWWFGTQKTKEVDVLNCCTASETCEVTGYCTS